MKKSINKIIFTLFVFLMLVLVFNYMYNNETSKIDTEIEKDFISKLSILSKLQLNKIPLNYIIENLSWDKICFYGPYDTKGPFPDNDGINTAVLYLKDKNVIIKIPRKLIESKSENYNCFSNNAKISFSKDKKIFNNIEHEVNYFLVEDN